MDKQFVIIGGGPAGLTAAHELTRRGIAAVVVEKDHIVGGLARTETYRGYHFDMGGHRFFTKSKEIQRRWQEIAGDDFLRRPRLSRIYYRKTFFNYPLKPLNALMGLGFVASSLILLSYLRWKALPYRQEETFEQWVTNRFGKRLFATFFKGYTEKIWGIPCSELRAEWAAQRIKNLSLKTALVSTLVKPASTVTTLIDSFHYPRLGPGMLWNAAKTEIEDRGGTVLTESGVICIHRTGNRVTGITVRRPGSTERLEGTHFISSIPVTELVGTLDPPPPADVLEAAGKLRFRDFLTVCLIVDTPELFPDNWIYVHDPEVKVGRIQNYKNWSPDMVPDSGKTSLGLEYFCQVGDELWRMSDGDLMELGRHELAHMGLVDPGAIRDGCVFRVPNAYPIYDAEYRAHLTTIRDYVNSLTNLQTIGRGGLYRYNNQDHSMLTGILAVRNAILGEANDLWSVNADEEYHEEIRESKEEAPDVEVRGALATAFSKLDRVAFGLSLGITAGVLLFLATWMLVIKGGAVVGPHLALLSQYFPGYRVTPVGSLLGLVYGFMAGFAAGWLYAFVRNAVVLLYLAVIQRRARQLLVRRWLDYI